MKKLIVFTAMLMTSSVALATQCSTERTIIKKIAPDGSEIVSEERNQVCKEKNKDVFSDCEMYQWKHSWGKGVAVSCNWSERQAMETALTHAPDGMKVEWYDASKNSKGYTVVSWTRPLSDQGWCRDIEMVRQYSNSLNKNSYIMCYSTGRGWQSFRGH
jgi:surface antigen